MDAPPHLGVRADLPFLLQRSEALLDGLGLLLQALQTLLHMGDLVLLAATAGSVVDGRAAAVGGRMMAPTMTTVVASGFTAHVITSSLLEIYHISIY